MILLTGNDPDLVRCNHCKSIIRKEHRRAHALDCKSRRNQKRLEELAMVRKGLCMYAIAAARNVNGNWVKEVHHVHAEDEKHARAQFCYTEPNRKLVHIIAVGLCIGWQANADSGELLAVQPS
jgi:hypothetical protein